MIDELTWTPEIEPAGIGIAVSDGVVTLAGETRSWSELLAAEKAIWRVKGVHTVVNDLTVRHTIEAEAADEEIGRRVNSALEWTAQLPAGEVHATVRDGSVILTGTVDWQFQRDAARKSVQDIEYVRHIDNRIELARRVSAADAEERIRNALRRHALIDADRITVAVEGTRVRLLGTAASFEERAEAQRAAWKSPHVSHVDNQIVVAS